MAVWKPGEEGDPLPIAGDDAIIFNYGPEKVSSPGAIKFSRGHYDREGEFFGLDSARN